MKLQSNRPNYSRPTPNFTAMKKMQFSGIDFAVVEKFKAPIEKFDNKTDFQTWAQKKCNEIINSDHGGRTTDVKFDRISQIDEWDSYISEYSPAEQLIVLNGITKGFKPNNETICPVYNQGILYKTMFDIKEKLANDRNYQFNFGKLYRANLREMYTKLGESDKNSTKWIVIPSKKSDSENYAENIKKLKSLSCHEWCTKYGGAELYLKDNDIHIFLEKGEPKLVVRCAEDMVKEINSEHNDFVIPKEYLDEIDSYLNKHNFLTSERVEKDLINSKNLANKKTFEEKTTNEQNQQIIHGNKQNGLLNFLKKLFK